MTSRPWMPLYIGDYLADTAHLTATEHGAYLLLLMHQWQHGRLPPDDELLARIARVHPPHWPRIKRVLGSFFETQEGGFLKNKRLDAELSKSNDVSQKRAKAARQKHIISRANADASENANAEQLHTHARGLPQSQPDKSISPPSEAPPPTPPSVTVPDDPAIISAGVAAYNAVAREVGLSAVQIMTKTRRTAMRSRLRECGGLPGWQAALDRAKASPFLTGDNDRGWRADFDFLTKPKNLTKLMEGGFDQPASTATTARNGSARSSRAGFLGRLAEIAATGVGEHQRPAGADDGIPDHAATGADDPAPPLDLGPADYRRAG